MYITISLWTSLWWWEWDSVLVEVTPGLRLYCYIKKKSNPANFMGNDHLMSMIYMIPKLYLWPGIGMENLSYLPVPDLEQPLGCHSLTLRILSSPLCDPYSWWLLPSVISNAFPSLWSKTGVATTVIPYCAECMTDNALAKWGTS